MMGDDAKVILHTHMPFVTTITLLRPECGGALLPVHQNIARFSKRVAYEHSYGGLFTGGDESERIAAAAFACREQTGQSPRALMCANHGVFVFGRSVAEAWSDLY